MDIITWLKEKLNAFTTWVRTKIKKILITLGIVSIAMAAPRVIPDRSFEALPNVHKEAGIYRITYDQWSDVEIGDKSTPEVKLRKWGDETWIKISYPDFSPVKNKQHEGKLKWVNGDKEVHLYPLEPREITENGYTFTQLEQGGFEFEIIFNKDPRLTKIGDYKIVIPIETKGLKFYYQPELTQQEKDEGAFQPENVVGSYAVYHATKGNMHAGQEEAEKYKTSKAFHIYRPKINDAIENWAWSEQEIIVDENGIGEQVITISGNFLDNAVYPVRHAGGDTFGYTTLGSFGGYTLENYIRTRIGNPGQNGTADSISVGIWQADYGYDDLKAALYVTGGNLESPQTETIIYASGVKYWETLNFSGGPTLSNQNYDIAAWGEDGIDSAKIAVDSGGASGDSKYQSESFGSWPADLSGATDTTWKYSVYCSYTPSAAEEEEEILPPEIIIWE